MSGGINPADDFANVTLDEYLEAKTRDQFFDDFTLLGWLERKVGMTRRSGGDKIAEILNLGENTRGGSYQGFDVFNNQPIETLRTAYFQFSKYEWPIDAGADEVLRNNSQAAILDLWMEKARVSLQSMRKRLNTDAFTDGTGNSNKNLDGLGIAVDSAGTYGQVSRTTYSIWGANEVPVGGALVIPSAVGMTKMFNDCGLGSDENATVDAIMTTQSLAESYEGLLGNDIRYAGGNGVGDGGFSSISFKGRPLMWDRAATSGILWMLTSNTFKMIVHPERDFSKTKIREPMSGTAVQDAYSANILLWIQMMCLEPRRNGKLTGAV
jgi:hypothetical protein